jgi:hypothetical protein
MGPLKHSAVSFGMSDTPPTQRQKEQRSNITAQRYKVDVGFMVYWSIMDDFDPL